MMLIFHLVIPTLSIERCHGERRMTLAEAHAQNDFQRRNGMVTLWIPDCPRWPVNKFEGAVSV
jgi:hypothetical protein